MTLTLALLLGQGPTPHSIFVRASEALAQKTSFHVVVKREVFAGATKVTATGDYSVVMPGNVVVRMTSTAPGGPDRGVQIDASDAVVIDYKANEYTKRRTTAKGAPLDRLKAVVGTVSSADAIAIDALELTNYLASLQKRQDLKVTLTGTVNKVIAGRDTVLAFNRKSGLLQTLTVVEKNSQMIANFDYLGKASQLTLELPRGAKQVQSFVKSDGGKPAPTVPALTQSAEAYRQLISANISTTCAGVTTKFIFDARNLYEDQGWFRWSFDGSRLLVVDLKRKKAFRGSTSRGRIVSYVAACGAQVDPMTRHILRRESPLLDVVGAGSKVTESGSMEIGGTGFDIVRSDTGPVHASILIRQDNRLIESVTADLFDKSGKKKMSTSLREYRYRDVNKAQTAASMYLAVPEGFKVLALPVLKE